MTQPPDAYDPMPNPQQQGPGGRRTTSGIVIVVIAALVIVAGIVGAIVLIRNTHIDFTSDAEAPTAPIITNNFDPPSNLTDLPSDITGLPTDDGPTEEQYLAVARAVVKAVAKGNCDKALTYLNPDYGDAAGAFGLCDGATKQAAADDDTTRHAIEFFGTFGAAVSFDNGQTYISMVAQPEGEPTVEFFLAY